MIDQCPPDELSKREGYWQHELRFGRGRYIAADCEVYIGSWKDDKKHGYSQTRFSDGTIYEGQYVNGMEDGFGFM